MKIAVNITPIEMFTADVPNRHTLNDIRLVHQLAKVNKDNANKGNTDRVVLISNRIGGFILPKNKR